MIYRSTPQGPDDRRQRMIDETSAWLTWMLDHDVELPKIPRRPVRDGGFSSLLNHPGARAAVNHWWSRTLSLMAAISDRFGV